jgi:hypothetical protein
MALKMDITTSDDNTISNAYFKIMTTIVEWEMNYAVIVLGAWKGRNAYLNRKRQIVLDQDLTFRMSFPPGTEMGSRTDIYTWLKTQPFFTTATDAQD